MPGIELGGFNPRIDQLSQKIQEIKERKSAANLDATMDSAMGVVEQNLGKNEVQAAHMSLEGLSEELAMQQVAAHSLDPAKVASLIADPFDD